MSIYGTDTRRWALIIATLVLFLLDVILLLPSPVDINTALDVSSTEPGGKVILWVIISNRSSHPLSGVVVRVDSLSPYIELNYREALPDVPPSGGVGTARVEFNVSPDAEPGDNLLRVFVSFPGNTRVLYQRVRIK